MGAGGVVGALDIMGGSDCCGSVWLLLLGMVRVDVSVWVEVVLLVDDEVVEEFAVLVFVVDGDGVTGVVDTVLDKLGIVGSISCFQIDTRRTQGIVSSGEFVVVPNVGTGSFRLGGITALNAG